MFPLFPIAIQSKAVYCVNCVKLQSLNLETNILYLIMQLYQKLGKQYCSNLLYSFTIFLKSISLFLTMVNGEK